MVRWDGPGTDEVERRTRPAQGVEVVVSYLVGVAIFILYVVAAMVALGGGP